MEKCPTCDNYITFNTKCICGQPFIYYTCSCGYDSSKVNYAFTTNTIDYTKEYLAINDRTS